MRKINIAIDGPAGSGKGTVAKLVAKELGYLYIDTGVMYRLLTYLVIDKKVDINDDVKIKDILIHEFDYEVRDERVYFENEDVTDLLRSKIVNDTVPSIACKQYVRNFLVNLQKQIASEKGVVMDGRDITSVVMKDAELKIYLDADFEERVKRRYLEFLKKKVNIDIEDVRENIRVRDYNDRVINKTLVKGEDSVLVDTTKTTVEEAVNEVLKLARERISNDWSSCGVYW